MTLPSRQEKPAYVSRMFGGIAGHYDLMNRLMTAGRDGAWRAAAVRWLDPQPGHLVLDVGTGTGDFLPLLAGRGCQAVGADFSLPMMRAGREKLARASAPVSLVAGDAMRLPFPDATFDGLVNGFLLRNVADLDAALAEMRRVLKPGGLAVCLEITWPRLPLFREAFGLYFGRLVPLLGRLISRDPEAYSYLPSSVAAFVSASELAERMQAVGFREVAYRRLALGAVALHRGVR
jgi:demethylmenaquinone methyltransferase/2-methoxy-6-polyprenyl-1,4-benzoquinol methylase